MNSRILWLRISYWVGAVVDAIAIIPMLFPKVREMMYGLTAFNPGVEYKFAMYTGASLMLGWTLILIWADRKPAERRGTLLAVLPVVLGIAAANVYAVVNGFIAIEKMIPVFTSQTVLLILFIFSYIYSRNITKVAAG